MMTGHRETVSNSFWKRHRASEASDGLGTLVQDGPDTYIVTQDHWSRPVDKLHKVQFRDAGGDLLLELDRALFYSLIRYRDGGLMVLAAPEEISSQITAVPVNKGASLTVGQPFPFPRWRMA
jgi:hypothetical protein